VTWLAFVLAFQLGYLPSAALAMYEPMSFLDSSGQFYQQAEAKAVLWNTVEVGGSMRVYDYVHKGEMAFFPTQLDSIFFADVILGPVKVGWIHECDHAIVPSQAVLGMKPMWDGSRDEVYVRVEFKWEGK